MVEVRITSRYCTDTRLSEESTVREAYEAELKAMEDAGWHVQGSKCTDNVGAILALRKRMEVSVLIYEQKPRKIGLFEKILEKVAKIFGR